MEQHPIPQQITSYEFKLVGDMTIRQFGKAAGGIILALIINSTQLIFFIKWPLILFFAAGGLALAFVPFQDRPLETWVFAFIKSIYSPTIFLWKKRPDPNWLEIDRNKRIEILNDDKDDDLPQKDSTKIAEFIASLPTVKVVEEGTLASDFKKEALERAARAQKDTNLTTATAKTESTEKVGQKADLNLKTTREQATGQVQFGTIPMPDPPEIPNVIVGMVTDQRGKIVEEAIIEIQDVEGNSVRVLKTNSLGQFKTATQLAKGTYLIIPEKDGLHFDKVNVEMAGSIMQPIKIQASV